MKSKILLSGALLAASLLTRVVGDIIVPGANGTDGVLNITTNTVIDLSQAVTAAWDSDNQANGGKGVYDPSKWAVVFKYSSVTIQSNATVTFRNHASRAPVVWLVSGDVVIDGKVDLDGESGQEPPILAEPGPGGFRGGQGFFRESLSKGAGFGIGGGANNVVSYPNGIGGTSGNYASIPGSMAAYGNPSNVQLIGGSGGGGAMPSGRGASGGGGGGGAILIASENTLKVNGQISANGGNPGTPNLTGSGSGGAIRLVCHEFQGRGLVSATGGFPYVGIGGNGRIRVERITSVGLNPGVVSFSPDPSVVTLARGSEATIWPPSGAPEVRITSIGGGSVSLDPRAGFGAFGPDVALPVTNRTFITVETKNVEPQSQVIVRVTPRANANFLEANAAIVSSTNNAIQWQAGMDVNVGYSAVQVRVVRP